MTPRRWLETNVLAMGMPSRWRGRRARQRKKSCKRWWALQQKQMLREFRYRSPLSKWLDWKKRTRGPCEGGRTLEIPLTTEGMRHE